VLKSDVFTGARVDRRMLVSSIEFEQRAALGGRIGFALPYISYPVISIRRDFLEGVASARAAAAAPGGAPLQGLPLSGGGGGGLAAEAGGPAA